MFDDVSDILTDMKEKAMEAVLPNRLPTKIKEKFLEMSHRMTPAEIAEVGKKFQEAHEKAMKEYFKRREQKAAQQ